MSYATLMVHLELDRSNAGLLAVAGEMADRFHSRVVGIAAGQPMVYASGDGYVPGDLIQQDIVYMENRIVALETEFRTAFGKSNTAIEWRSKVTYGPLADYLAAEARCADLILTGSPGKEGSAGLLAFNVGALALQAGRPVLVVPAAAETLKLGKVVVCWRDTREARRAVADALGLLKQAEAVDVLEVTSDDLMAVTRVPAPGRRRVARPERRRGHGDRDAGGRRREGDLGRAHRGAWGPTSSSPAPTATAVCTSGCSAA